MFRYLLRRILLFIPTLFVISLVAFWLGAAAPGDPVKQTFGLENNPGNSLNRERYLEKYRQLGLHLPLFYFSLTTLAEPSELFKTENPVTRDWLRQLTRHYGNWTEVKVYADAVKEAQEAAALSEDASSALFQLQSAVAEEDIAELIKRIQAAEGEEGFTRLAQCFESLKTNQQTWKRYVPMLHCHREQNQYHRWLRGVVLHADFGISYRNSQPVRERIAEKLQWSLLLTFFSVLLAYIIAIPIGIYAAYKRHKAFDRISATLLFMLYSLPNFFVGTMLLLLFANPDRLDIFPSGGVQDTVYYDPEWPWWQRLGHHLPYLVLPMLTFAYSAWALLSRQMRVALLDTLLHDYIRTARAKGLPERKVILKHAFRNALLPMITLFAHVFPLAVGGAVIVEAIFNIPGMGLEIYEAVLHRDYPMIVAIFTIFGALTMLGYLVADVLYAWADPRIKFGGG